MSASVISGMVELRTSKSVSSMPNLPHSRHWEGHLQIEYPCEEKHKYGNSQVDPLHILQSFLVLASLEKEDI
jgi:hypothetical protein